MIRTVGTRVNPLCFQGATLRIATYQVSDTRPTWWYGQEGDMPDSVGTGDWVTTL